mgnify:CR=1 FL=1
MAYNKRIVLFLVFGLLFLSLGTRIVKFEAMGFGSGWEGLDATLQGARFFWQNTEYTSENGLQLGTSGIYRVTYDIQSDSIKENDFPTMGWSISEPEHVKFNERGQLVQALETDYVKKWVKNVSITEEITYQDEDTTITEVTWVERTFYLRYFSLNVKAQTMVQPAIDRQELYIHHYLADWYLYIKDSDFDDPSQRIYIDWANSDGLGKEFTDIKIWIPVTVDMWDNVARDPSAWSGIMTCYSIGVDHGTTAENPETIEDPAIWNHHTPTTYHEMYPHNAYVPLNMYYADKESIWGGTDGDTYQGSGGLDSDIPDTIYVELEVRRARADVALHQHTFDTHGKGWYIDAIFADKDHDYNGWDHPDGNDWDSEVLDVFEWLQGDHTYDYIDAYQVVDVWFEWDLLFEVIMTEDTVYTTTITNEAGRTTSDTHIGTWGNFQESPMFSWIMWIIIIIIVFALLKWLFGKKHPQGGASLLTKIGYIAIGIIIGIFLPLILFFVGIFRWFFAIMFSSFEIATYNIFSTFFVDKSGADTTMATVLSSDITWITLGMIMLIGAIIWYWIKERTDNGEYKENLAYRILPVVIPFIIFISIMIYGIVLFLIPLDIYAGLTIFFVGLGGLFLYITMEFLVLTNEENSKINSFQAIYFTLILLGTIMMWVTQINNLVNPTTQRNYALAIFWLSIFTFLLVDSILRVYNSMKNKESIGLIRYVDTYRVIFVVIGITLAYLFAAHVLPLGISNTIIKIIQAIFLTIMGIGLYSLTSKYFLQELYTRLRGTYYEPELRKIELS